MKNLGFIFFVIKCLIKSHKLSFIVANILLAIAVYYIASPYYFNAINNIESENLTTLEDIPEPDKTAEVTEEQKTEPQNQTAEQKAEKTQEIPEQKPVKAKDFPKKQLAKAPKSKEIQQEKPLADSKPNEIYEPQESQEITPPKPTASSAAKGKKLTWSSKSPYQIDWYGAKSYCKRLEENGHKDWKLPTIDDLRSLVIGCPKTELGGACRISEKNSSLSSENDWSQACEGCDVAKFYSKLSDKSVFWSSSAEKDEIKKDYYWVVNFRGGFITSFHYAASASVRCVRTVK